ncbi:hypothetical protein DsansV1_C49g0244601 [Dioscorea sansibarensis]
MAICTNKNDESNYVSKENGIEKRGTPIKEGFIQPRERDFICRHNSVNGILDISDHKTKTEYQGSHKLSRPQSSK